MGLVITLQYLLLLVLSEGINGDGHPNLSLLPEECGFIDVERQPESKYARLYEFPWMTHIFRFASDGGREFICSGTVINQWYVLTAAHCTKRNPTQVRVGDYDRQQDVDCEGQEPPLLCEDQFQEIDIEEAIVHQNYTLYVDDIALLRLKTPIDFSQKNAAPICLPTTTELQSKSLVGQEAIIAGWELPFTPVTSSKMHKSKAPILEYTECAKQASSRYQNIKTDICIGVEDVCTLISGSPLMLPSAVKDDGYRYVQYGFVHMGTRCGDAKTFFVDVSKYVNWILDNLKA